jgi:Methylase of polypeptide chain release factors
MGASQYSATMRHQLMSKIAEWKAAPYARLRAARHRGWTYDRITSELCTATGYTVAAGPYAGMNYFGPPGIPIIDSLPTAKLLGSFEEELHPWIETLVERQFERITHIGSGEGYHVIGMARRMPQARTVVFDTLIAARKACWRLAEQNKVRDRVQLRGYCEAGSLRDIDLAGSLIFSDCGGTELIMLDPMLYPALATATMLVETHDAFDVRITPRLIARFSSTHKIEFVSATQRNPANYPALNGVELEIARKALDENRQMSRAGKPQAWALLTPYTS